MIQDMLILLIVIILAYILFFIIIFAVSILTFEPDIGTAAKYSAIGACMGPVLSIIKIL